jgi:hypothetical protein
VAVTLSPNTPLVGGFVSAFPEVKVTSVDGEPVPETPTGGFTPADVTILNPDPVLIELEARNVPVGTQVSVEVHSESLTSVTYLSSPLVGTDESSTASLMAPIAPGFSFVTVRADWEP